MAGGFADVALVFSELAIAGDVHAENICLWLSMDHPFGQGFANSPTLKETSHHGTGAPIAGFSWNGTDQRIAIGGKGEGSVDPCFNTNVLQGRVAFETTNQLMFNAVGLFLE